MFQISSFNQETQERAATALTKVTQYTSATQNSWTELCSSVEEQSNAQAVKFTEQVAVYDKHVNVSKALYSIYRSFQRTNSTL